MAKLTDLNPSWLDAGGEGISRADTGEPVPHQRGVGVMCDCPCGCEKELFVPFKVALDGTPHRTDKGWDRTGDTFETLTLTPSIRRIGGCGWHGFITNGQVKTV